MSNCQNFSVFDFSSFAPNYNHGFTAAPFPILENFFDYKKEIP